MDWETRAIKAEKMLAEIASIPSESWGWRSIRRKMAEDYLMELEQNHLCYIRPAPEKEWCAELCVRGEDNIYRSILLSDMALFNLAKQAVDAASAKGRNLVRQIESMNAETLSNQHQSQHQQNSEQTQSDSEPTG